MDTTINTDDLTEKSLKALVKESWTRDQFKFWAANPPETLDEIDDIGELYDDVFRRADSSLRVMYFHHPNWGDHHRGFEVAAHDDNELLESQGIVMPADIPIGPKAYEQFINAIVETMAACLRENEEMDDED